MASSMGLASIEAGPVRHAASPLRRSVARAGVAWDESVITGLRHAAQVPAAALMAHALQEYEAVKR